MASLLATMFLSQNMAVLHKGSPKPGNTKKTDESRLMFTHFSPKIQSKAAGSISNSHDFSYGAGPTRNSVTEA
ncbi:hypothetical protein Z517_09261 [Fonsecaea pedrosoi CBS 271.37]|uniref:Unplaced genomic scaffold supercont1.6, whole genome shotgun sequence n=1 Tax=Fonsecaea pedrosoi CBS 271.37 TaxID=1442368 RepID=A0A0D2ERD4_9EURO|nr:uncharacterized protein Z517_09261 [Fonsecaea pedrosoi CBS 271.37]KIW76817.1 hypothetical protein Z517_09261 [Fonsecaea pedrosoi CBS 271.37]